MKHRPLHRSHPWNIGLGLSLALLLGALATLGARHEQAPEGPKPAARCLEAHEPADAALTAAQRQARAHPQQAQAWVRAGEAWLKLARRSRRSAQHAAALACARQALALAPDQPDALALQGLERMEAHRFGEAARLGQRIVALDPHHRVGWALLSDAQLELGNVDAAVTAAQRLMDLEPGLPAYARAAHLRAVLGDPAGAKRLYREAIGIGQHGGDPEALAWVLTEAAKLFEQQGDRQGAQAGFEQALAVLPGYPLAVDGMRRVRGEGAPGSGGGHRH